MNRPILNQLQAEAREIWMKEGILGESIAITARTLSTEEAIGNPEGDDFPLQRGKEKLMEAQFRNERGQAFTDTFGDFSSSLREIAEMKLDNNFRRAIFVASLNAVQRSLGKTDRTIHCRDKGPSICAPKMADYIMEKYGQVRITQIGYQPKLIEALAEKFTLRIVDLDPDNIGNQKCGVVIEGPDSSAAAVADAELIVATGSTIVNDTIGDFILKDKPTLFFGTTVAAAADHLGLKRFCCESN
ncbi:Rossmann-like domain-containing protein [Desulfotalea psychrophila]|uniref:Putative heavy-metal chelation domain-containing protein n=1 Tax=Desulfotalea psychrophila (strain LSv54 / DSM 12343) TaxID=177439 RepID=Q6AR32_DESPS|nr:DUF364 domain-containing protein [Desulfotalea psychrophila]CAG35192.1 hypothetical protein DP0463 [Desulfotalea psychrophila LSv54]